MLGAILTLLNSVLKPFYDAFYKVFLVVRSLALSTSSRIRFPEGTRYLNLEPSHCPAP